MNNLILRQVEETDNNPLAKIIRCVFNEYDAPHQGTVYSDITTDNLFALFQKPGCMLWVAVFDEQILGCCGIYSTEGLPEDYAELAKFYLLHEARGKGIGKKLMLQCFQSAIQMGYKKLYIESLPQFSQAVSMYEKYGFTRLSKALGNSGHTSCSIWMIKDLASV